MKKKKTVSNWIELNKDYLASHDMIQKNLDDIQSFSSNKAPKDADATLLEMLPGFSWKSL